MRYDWKSYASRLVPFSAGYPGREIRAIAARLEEAAVSRATATTGAEAHGDSICFTRPWKGRSSTVMHTLLVFPQPLEGGGHNSENPSLRENSLRRPRERLAGRDLSTARADSLGSSACFAQDDR